MMSTSFGSLKQINAGVLNVGYAEAGPPDGRAVILLHGWPYDIHSYVDVAPRLSEAGCKALVSVSGYLIGSQEADKMPLPPKAELEWWYQYYFATEHGRAGYETPDAPFQFILGSIAHFRRTKKLSPPDQQNNRSNSQSV